MPRTIEEIVDRYPGTKKGDWRQHPNGGGWVFKTAKVEATAFVGPDARVLDRAVIEDNARIEDFARVMHSADVSDDAIVRDRAIIEHDASVFDNAVIFGGARIGGYAHISGTAAIGGYARIIIGKITRGTRKTTPIQIQGTHFPMNQSGPGVFKIGCEEHTWAYWDENLEKIAKQNKTNPRQYRVIFDAINSLRPKRKSDG